jgi:hypothetical protein
MDPAWLLLRHVLFLSFACRAGKGWARAMKRLGLTFDPLSARPDKAQTWVAQGPIRRRVSRLSRLAAGIFPSVAKAAALERVSLTGSLPAGIKLAPLKPNCVANGKHNRHLPVCILASGRAGFGMYLQGARGEAGPALLADLVVPRAAISLGRPLPARGHPFDGNA